MQSKYDILLKDLFQDEPSVLLEELTGYKEGKFINCEFPNIQYKVGDLLRELPDGTLFHLEIQSTNDRKMVSRMNIYCSLIYDRYEKDISQMVLYIGSEKMNM